MSMGNIIDRFFRKTRINTHLIVKDSLNEISLFKLLDLLRGLKTQFLMNMVTKRSTLIGRKPLYKPRT